MIRSCRVPSHATRTGLSSSPELMMIGRWARRYLDLMVGGLVLRLLSPWHEDLVSHPKVGASWEGFVRGADGLDSRSKCCTRGSVLWRLRGWNWTFGSGVRHQGAAQYLAPSLRSSSVWSG